MAQFMNDLHKRIMLTHALQKYTRLSSYYCHIFLSSTQENSVSHRWCRLTRPYQFCSWRAEISSTFWCTRKMLLNRSSSSQCCFFLVLGKRSNLYFINDKVNENITSRSFCFSLNKLSKQEIKAGIQFASFT